MKCTFMLLDCLRKYESKKKFNDSRMISLMKYLNEIYLKEEFIFYICRPSLFVQKDSKSSVQYILKNHYEKSLDVIKEEAIVSKSGYSCKHY